MKFSEAVRMFNELSEEDKKVLQVLSWEFDKYSRDGVTFSKLVVPLNAHWTIPGRDSKAELHCQLAKLIKYGFITKRDEKYVPRFTYNELEYGEVHCKIHIMINDRDKIIFTGGENLPHELLVKNGEEIAILSVNKLLAEVAKSIVYFVRK